MPSRTGTVAAIFVAVLATLYVYFSKHQSLCYSLCPSTCSSDTNGLFTGYFEYECAGKPHHSTWDSWWHPERSEGTPTERGQGAGAITRDWNILYHLGGNGPWVEKVIDVVDGGIAVPEGCVVEQVHMVGHVMAGSIS
jgi:acid phosphatase